MATDLFEIVQAFAGPDAVVAGYSMGAATALFALGAGLTIRGAVLGATPTAVLRWSRPTSVNARRPSQCSKIKPRPTRR